MIDLEIAAVDQRGVVCLLLESEVDLIQQSAADADIIVLGHLGKTGDLQRLEFSAERLQQKQDGRVLEGCTAA